jgi:hypothetical protein
MEAGAIGGGGVTPGGAIVRRACAGCGGLLARDQRYCLNCGRRVGGLRVPGLRAAAGGRPGQRQPSLLRLPAPRSAGALAGLTLAFGVFIGLAMSPAFNGALLAGGRFVIELPPGGDEPAAAAGEASAALSSPEGNVVASGPRAPAQAGGKTQVPTQPAPAATPSDTSPSKDAGGGGPGGNGDNQGRPRRPPENPTIEGTVVHVNRVADSYSVATTDGQLVPIHDADVPIDDADLPEPRTNLTVEVEELFNGTFAELEDPETSGTSDHATFSGIVTYVDPDADVYTVSVAGASVLVHVPAGDGAPPNLPDLATEVVVDVGIDLPTGSSKRAPRRAGAARGVTRAAAPADGCAVEPRPGPKPSSALQERNLIVFGPPVGAIHMEAIVERSCQVTHELELSADDVREAESDVLVGAPAAIDLSLLEPGKAVSATVTIDAEGSYDLTGVSSDDGAGGADDPSTGQGDQAGSKRAVRPSAFSGP